MCVSPITIRYTNVFTKGTGYKSIQVPCGKCVECLKKYQNDWMLRINEEIKHHGYKGCFLTLTYSPEHVPTVIDKDTGVFYYSVCKRHVQNCIKRFRTNFYRKHGKLAKFSYFVTSEYGPRTLRPHYHAIFCGLSREDMLPFISDWQSNYGFVNAKDLYGDVSKAARYVAKYCSKGVFENPFVKQGFVAKTFHLISKGLGRSFADIPSVQRYYYKWPASEKYDLKAMQSSPGVIYSDKFLEFVTSLRMHMNGYDYSLPRYYKLLFYGTKNSLSVQAQDFLFNRASKLRDDKCRQVQAERHCSFNEASHIVFLQEVSEIKQREENARSSLAKWFDKSKI